MSVRAVTQHSPLPVLSVPLAMTSIRPRWPAEAVDRLLAADALIAQDSGEEDDEEEEQEPDEQEDDEDEDGEDESDGYSE